MLLPFVLDLQALLEFPEHQVDPEQRKNNNQSGGIIIIKTMYLTLKAIN